MLYVFRYALVLAFAIALLLSFSLYKIDIVWDYLSRFSYSTQERIVIIFLACVSIPAAFTIIHWEIKLGHLSEDDQHAFGIYCKHCGNGFVGLVDVFPKQNFHEENAAIENDESKQENSD